MMIARVRGVTAASITSRSRVEGLLVHAHTYGLTTGGQDHCLVEEPRRAYEDHLVAGIDDGAQRQSERAGGATGEDDVTWTEGKRKTSSQALSAAAAVAVASSMP
jgi:hypothetical protein